MATALHPAQHSTLPAACFGAGANELHHRLRGGGVGHHVLQRRKQHPAWVHERQLLQYVLILVCIRMCNFLVDCQPATGCVSEGQHRTQPQSQLPHTQTPPPAGTVRTPFRPHGGDNRCGRHRQQHGLGARVQAQQVFDKQDKAGAGQHSPATSHVRHVGVDMPLQPASPQTPHAHLLGSDVPRATCDVRPPSRTARTTRWPRQADPHPSPPTTAFPS